MRHNWKKTLIPPTTLLVQETNSSYSVTIFFKTTIFTLIWFFWRQLIANWDTKTSWNFNDFCLFYRFLTFCYTFGKNSLWISLLQGKNSNAFDAHRTSYLKEIHLHHSILLQILSPMSSVREHHQLHCALRIS